MGQRFLRYVLIVEDGIAGNRRGQLFTTVEARAGQDVADTFVEAFDHAVDLRTPGHLIHAYATRAEAIKKAADVCNRIRLTPLVRALLRRWLRP